MEKENEKSKTLVTDIKEALNQNWPGANSGGPIYDKETPPVLEGEFVEFGNKQNKGHIYPEELFNKELDLLKNKTGFTGSNDGSGSVGTIGTSGIKGKSYFYGPTKKFNILKRKKRRIQKQSRKVNR